MFDVTWTNTYRAALDFLVWLEPLISFFVWFGVGMTVLGLAWSMLAGGAFGGSIGSASARVGGRAGGVAGMAGSLVKIASKKGADPEAEGAVASADAEAGRSKGDGYDEAFNNRPGPDASDAEHRAWMDRYTT